LYKENANEANILKFGVLPAVMLTVTHPESAEKPSFLSPSEQNYHRE
jgi:hypothetical protein